MPDKKEITLLPRKKIVPKFPPGLLEKVLFTILICSIIIWIGQTYYKKSLQGEFDYLNSLIRETEQRRDKNLEEEIYLAGERLGMLEKIVTPHLYWTKIFERLEDLTVPTVWFSDFRAQNSGDAQLEGFASSYSSLARQFVSFSQDTTFKEINLSSITTGEAGEIGFTFKLLFEPEILFK